MTDAQETAADTSLRTTGGAPPDDVAPAPIPLLEPREGIPPVVATDDALARFRRAARGLGVDWPEGQSYGDLVRSLDRSNPRHLALIHEATTLFRGAGYTAFDGELPANTRHAALATDYAHVTAPLRRLVDRFAGEVCLALAAQLDVPDWARSALADLPALMASAESRSKKYERAVIDLVEVSGDGVEPDTHFMVMAGMGFDAAIMEGVNEDIKKRVGWLAYVISGLKSLMFPAGRFEVSVDGGEFTKHRARTVVVGNVGFLQAGLPLLPDAAIDDGQLDVVILHPRNFLAWIPLAWQVLLKLKHTDDLVNRMTGSTVLIRCSTDTPRQLDGDSIGPGKELHMECIHGRLLVRVPR